MKIELGFRCNLSITYLKCKTHKHLIFYFASFFSHERWRFVKEEKKTGLTKWYYYTEYFLNIGKHSVTVTKPVSFDSIVPFKIIIIMIFINRFYGFIIIKIIIYFLIISFSGFRSLSPWSEFELPTKRMYRSSARHWFISKSAHRSAAVPLYKSRARTSFTPLLLHLLTSTEVT